MYCLFFSFFFVYRLLNEIYVSTWPWIQWPHLIHLLNLIFLNFDLDFLGTKGKLFENNDYFISSISIQILSLSFVCLMTLVRTSSTVCNFLSCNIFVRFWNQVILASEKKKKFVLLFLKRYSLEVSKIDDIIFLSIVLSHQWLHIGLHSLWWKGLFVCLNNTLNFNIYKPSVF